MLVIQNTSETELTLKKKCDAIAYHVICESVAMRGSLTGHVKSEDNPAYLLTKVKRKNIVSLVLYDIYDGDT